MHIDNFIYFKIYNINANEKTAFFLVQIYDLVILIFIHVYTFTLYQCESNIHDQELVKLHLRKFSNVLDVLCSFFYKVNECLYT